MYPSISVFMILPSLDLNGKLDKRQFKTKEK